MRHTDRGQRVTNLTQQLATMSDNQHTFFILGYPSSYVAEDYCLAGSRRGNKKSPPFACTKAIAHRLDGHLLVVSKLNHVFPYVADYLRLGLPADFQSALTTRPKLILLKFLAALFKPLAIMLRNLFAGLGNAAL